MRRLSVAAAFVAAGWLAFSCASCKREERGFRVDPPAANSIYAVTMSDLHAGASTMPSAIPTPVKNEYEENAYALSQGQQLFSQYNCTGCHFHGGGGIGPPLMDETWIYGSRPEQIFASIVEGRPNGMPSFRDKIPDFQVWQLAAYVRSLGGLTSPAAAPGREDHINSTTPPNSVKPEKPKNSVLPKSAEMPG